jgi:hypothetical protein
MTPLVITQVPLSVCEILKTIICLNIVLHHSKLEDVKWAAQHGQAELTNISRIITQALNPGATPPTSPPSTSAT